MGGAEGGAGDGSGPTPELWISWYAVGMRGMQEGARWVPVVGGFRSSRSAAR
jgi:hypothetical protein